MIDKEIDKFIEERFGNNNNQDDNELLFLKKDYYAHFKHLYDELVIKPANGKTRLQQCREDLLRRLLKDK